MSDLTLPEISQIDEDTGWKYREQLVELDRMIAEQWGDYVGVQMSRHGYYVGWHSSNQSGRRSGLPRASSSVGEALWVVIRNVEKQPADRQVEFWKALASELGHIGTHIPIQSITKLSPIGIAKAAGIAVVKVPNG